VSKRLRIYAVMRRNGDGVAEWLMWDTEELHLDNSKWKWTTAAPDGFDKDYATNLASEVGGIVVEFIEQDAEIARLNVALRLCWYEGHELIDAVEDEHEEYLKKAGEWLAADRKCTACRQCHSTHVSGKPEAAEFHCDWDRDEFDYADGTCEFWYWRKESKAMEEVMCPVNQTWREGVDIPDFCDFEKGMICGEEKVRGCWLKYQSKRHGEVECE